MKLEAWCEWRKWCSILRVKNPQPTRDELDAGKADTLLPDTRKNYHRYLCNCIFFGVKRLDLQTDSPYSVYENIGYAHNREDFLSFFDELMNGKMPRIKGIYKNERIPFVGSFILFMQSPAGWLCIALVLVAVIATPILEKSIEKQTRERLVALGVIDDVIVITTDGNSP